MRTRVGVSVVLYKKTFIRLSVSHSDHTFIFFHRFVIDWSPYSVELQLAHQTGDVHPLPCAGEPLFCRGGSTRAQ